MRILDASVALDQVLLASHDPVLVVGSIVAIAVQNPVAPLKRFTTRALTSPCLVVTVNPAPNVTMSGSGVGNASVS